MKLNELISDLSKLQSKATAYDAMMPIMEKAHALVHKYKIGMIGDSVLMCVLQDYERLKQIELLGKKQ